MTPPCHTKRLSRVQLEILNFFAEAPIDWEFNGSELYQILNIPRNTMFNNLYILWGRKYLSRRDVIIQGSGGGPRALYSLTKKGCDAYLEERSKVLRPIGI